ncbi:TrkA C-terminal domain-containing protein [Finegoldia magna]|uniref:TrkA C-terminal domain-containing protein n=1 Tax=Finegoldia magna TaxID=1260 RepID=UPI0026E9EC68|nr:TrkA C-terminal domain-containing protein [Finegoldia magna]
MYILIVAIVLLLALLAVKFSDKFDIIVAKIIRNNKLVIPRGDTVICANDTVVIGGKSYFDPTGYGLIEITISDKNNWNGKKLKDIDMIDSELVVMIQAKNGEIIVPTGNVTLNEADKLIILKETVKF